MRMQPDLAVDFEEKVPFLCSKVLIMMPTQLLLCLIKLTAFPLEKAKLNISGILHLIYTLLSLARSLHLSFSFSTEVGHVSLVFVTEKKQSTYIVQFNYISVVNTLHF